MLVFTVMEECERDPGNLLIMPLIRLATVKHKMMSSVLRNLAAGLSYLTHLPLLFSHHHHALIWPFTYEWQSVSMTAQIRRLTTKFSARAVHINCLRQWCLAAQWVQINSRDLEISQGDFGPSCPFYHNLESSFPRSFQLLTLKLASGPWSLILKRYFQHQSQCHSVPYSLSLIYYGKNP